MTGRATFACSQRLTLDREYRAAFGAKLRKARHPLVVFGCPNRLGRPRLGLSVGRRVGPAVVRNRVKRMIREAFRLNQADLPVGYDLLVSVRPHKPLPLREYERVLILLASQIDAEHRKRVARGRP